MLSRPGGPHQRSSGPLTAPCFGGLAEKRRDGEGTMYDLDGYYFVLDRALALAAAAGRTEPSNEDYQAAMAW